MNVSRVGLNVGFRSLKVSGDVECYKGLVKNVTQKIEPYEVKKIIKEGNDSVIEYETYSIGVTRENRRFFVHHGDKFDPQKHERLINDFHMASLHDGVDIEHV